MSTQYLETVIRMRQQNAHKIRDTYVDNPQYKELCKMQRIYEKAQPQDKEAIKRIYQELSLIEKAYKTKYYRELELIDIQIDLLSKQRQAHGELPRRNFVQIRMTPEEYEKWKRQRGIEDIFHKYRTGDNHSNTLVAVLTPAGDPLYLEYIITPIKAHYEQFPGIPRPLHEQMERNLWTRSDIEYIYNLPFKLK